MERSEINKMVKELSRVKHLMTPWESHPKGQLGPADKGGFMEGIESAAAHGWDITEKRLEIIDKLYRKYVLGESVPKSNGGVSHPPRLTNNGDNFKIGEIEGIRAPEGWRLKIYGTLIGMPVIREHAYIIASWMDVSLPALEKFLMKLKGDAYEQPQEPTKAPAFPPTEDDSF